MTKLAKVQGIKCFKRALSGSSKLQQNLPRSLHPLSINKGRRESSCKTVIIEH